MQKKTPPYGKPLRDLQALGFRPSNDINLFIGRSAWHKGEQLSRSYPRRTLVLPAWLSPADYDWPVKQCSIIIFDTGWAEEDYINELAYCLYQSEAEIVRSISADFQLTICHKE